MDNPIKYSRFCPGDDEVTEDGNFRDYILDIQEHASSAKQLLSLIT